MNQTPRKALGDVNCNRGLSLSGKPAAPLKPLVNNKSVTKKPIQNILKQSGFEKENKGLGVKIKHSFENRQNKHGQVIKVLHFYPHIIYFFGLKKCIYVINISKR